MNKHLEKEDVRIDELDQKIIAFFQRDGRSSYTEIAEELGITVGTVRNRVQRLIENKIMKIVGVVDPFKTGMESVSMFGLKVQLNKLDEVVQKLVKIPEVRFVAAATGAFDLYVQIITSSNKELYRIMKEELSEIDGILSTDSSMILELHKQSYDWGVNLP
ncbi:Lrp/AsnC family transcriptional regulator [Salirhabdus salicampi]|uniref:Lrp/AsnC family transcriptional regulator n=1 Tax=Salirhabdus salicampi TaxID=476102 RepID=UPI0020C227F4|nr:Lrp/AsnC family transcriptional regulator [Salirhabdus salicampi]MCP8615703.1 Lrp/AsnC family transcriptional regulator [Salirhabdus salicampi]